METQASIMRSWLNLDEASVLVTIINEAGGLSKKGALLSKKGLSSKKGGLSGSRRLRAREVYFLLPVWSHCFESNPSYQASTHRGSWMLQAREAEEKCLESGATFGRRLKWKDGISGAEITMMARKGSLKIISSAKF